MRRHLPLTLLLLVPALGVGPGKAAAQEVRCDLVPSVQPLRDEDKSKQEVTLAGQVENRGNGVARVVQSRLQIVSMPGDKVLDDEKQPVTPPTLGPGEKARFKVTASNKGGQYVDTTTKENLTFEASSCVAPETSATSATGEGSGSCDLVIRQPVEKNIDDQAHTITFTGKVENHGSGVAKGVEVTGFVIANDKLLQQRSERTNPANIDPTGLADFQVTVPLEPGMRQSFNDRVTVKYARCD